MRIIDCVKQVCRHINWMGLTMAQAQVLMALAEGPKTMKELMIDTCSSRTNINHGIRKLAERNLVTITHTKTKVYRLTLIGQDAVATILRMEKEKPKYDIYAKQK